MAREIVEGGFALSEAGLRVGSVEQCLGAGLVRVGVEREQLPAAAFSLAVADEIAQALAFICPASDDGRERLHIGLRVAAIDAKRMQFEDFAGEVLVDAARSPAAGQTARAARVLRSLAVGADGEPIVEIDDHARMLRRCAQHIGEAAPDMRSDGVFLERGRQRDGGGLGGGDRKVIGPEVHKAFVHGTFAGDGCLDARADGAGHTLAEVLDEILFNREPT